MISISVTLMSLKISKYHALPLSLIKYAANLINMLTFEHLPLLERLRQSILSNFGKRPSPKKTSTGYQKMCRCLCWSPEALRQLEVWALRGVLNFQCHYIAFLCIVLVCIVCVDWGDIEGYLMPEAASPVSESDSPHSDVETSQQWQYWEEIHFVCHQVCIILKISNAILQFS